MCNPSSVKIVYIYNAVDLKCGQVWTRRSARRCTDSLCNWSYRLENYAIESLYVTGCAGLRCNKHSNELVVLGANQEGISLSQPGEVNEVFGYRR